MKKPLVTSSYQKLNHTFAGFGRLFWIFAYILAAHISAVQVGPKFKKVHQTQQSHDLTAVTLRSSQFGYTRISLKAEKFKKFRKSWNQRISKPQFKTFNCHFNFGKWLLCNFHSKLQRTIYLSINEKVLCKKSIPSASVWPKNPYFL